MGHRGISFSDVVPIFICLPSKGFWAFSASQCISFFCFGLQENSFYVSMAGNHEIICWTFSVVLELYFLSKKDFFRFGLCPCNLLWTSYTKSKLSATSMVVCQAELMPVMFGLWRSDISVCQAEINLKSGTFTAVCCSRPSYLQSCLLLHSMPRMLCIIKTVWIVQCHFME